MGSTERDLGSCNMERPQHRVAVPQFFMGQTLVTQAQWRTVAALPAVNQKLKADPSWFKGDDRPVEQVSWFDAMEFCARLSVFSGKLITLPSEAQWEYACRARTTTVYAFGDVLTREMANFDLHRNQTTPVGIFPANNWGLYDMHGNAWEWCLDDWHPDYKGAPCDGSAWLENSNTGKFYAADPGISALGTAARPAAQLVATGTSRSGSATTEAFALSTRKLLRGGSWHSYPVRCRSAFRTYFHPANAHNWIGFRVCCLP